MIEPRRALHAFAAALFFFIAPPSKAATGTLPVASTNGSGYEFDARAFAKVGDFSLLAERVQRWDTNTRRPQFYSLGGYYRLLEALKIGLFYRRAYGLRHDNDWVNSGTGWAWAHSINRGENILLADATPKMELAFLPGESWVGELKIRYFYNFFNSNQTLTARPGLTYFWLREGEPFLNFFLQYELSVPVNFGQTALNEEWLYIGTLYQVAKFLQMGVFATFHTETWSTSASFAKLFTQDYTVKDRSLVLGGNLILQF